MTTTSNRPHSSPRYYFLAIPTLSFVVDLSCGNDLVENGDKRLVLDDDTRRHEWRHDELPLSDVRFHGNPKKREGRHNRRGKNSLEVTKLLQCVMASAQNKQQFEKNKSDKERNNLLI